MAAHDSGLIDLPKRWGNVKDLFDIATVHGYLGKPTELEPNKMWLVRYAYDDMTAEKFEEIVKDKKYAIENATIALWDDIWVAFYCFRSAKTVKVFEGDIQGHHASIVEPKKKKEFLHHFLRGGCIVVGRRELAKFVKLGSKKIPGNALKFYLAESYNFVTPFDDDFRRPEREEESETEEEEFEPDIE